MSAKLIRGRTCKYYLPVKFESDSSKSVVKESLITESRRDN